MPFLLTLNYFLIYSSVFVVVEFQQVLLWLILINFLSFFFQCNMKCTLIIDFNKFNLKLELFLTDPFQAIVQIRVYYPTCLA